MLGLAAKAGKIISGSEPCEKAVKFDKVALTIVAEDASENTKKMFFDMCNFREVTFRYYGRKDLIGKFIGKDVRSVIVFKDQNFARRILELIDSERESNGGEVFGEN
jgi:ribosomal protein L7Ae-like RNA K-turn-binding protein